MKLFKKYDLEIKRSSLDLKPYVYVENKEKLILAQFIDHWNNAKDIIEDLLPELEPVLTGELEYNDIGADIVGLAYIEFNTTKLMGSDVGYKDMVLPTEDFNGLILEWIEFLESQGR